MTTLVLGYYAAIANKKGKISTLCLIIIVGTLIYGFHVYTIMKPIREEYRISIEKFEKEILKFEENKDCIILK
jgi:hypothetical protein